MILLLILLTHSTILIIVGSLEIQVFLFKCIHKLPSTWNNNKIKRFIRGNPTLRKVEICNSVSTRVLTQPAAHGSRYAARQLITST